METQHADHQPKRRQGKFLPPRCKACKGEIVTITRHPKPVAALVSVEAAEIARGALDRKGAGLVTYLRTFPGGASPRNRKPSRDVEL